jgi:hypothetical protein
MLRYLTILLFIIALVHGAGGYGNFAAASVAGDGYVVTALDAPAAEHSRGKAGSPTQSRCFHVSCSHTFALPAKTALFSVEVRSAARRVVDEGDRRSIILKRDPPIPRSLI